LRKTRQGKKFNIKSSAIRRDRNIDFLQLYLNTSAKKGKKETFFKHFNTASHKIMFHFEEKDDFFVNSPRFYYYYYISRDICMYRNLENIIDESIDNLQVLFTIKYKKLDKQQRLKYKEKYKLEIKNVNPKKRFKHILNLLNKSSSEMKFKTLNERLLHTFSDTCFDIKKSYINKRKVHIYSLVLEEIRKKTE